MYIQIGQSGKMPLIGRLHKLECQEQDFDLALNERLQVKVLKVTQADGGRQLVELTRRKEHLSS